MASSMSKALSGARIAKRGPAIVTGSSRGIGRAIALRLAADGHDVAINDVKQNEEGIHNLVKEIKGTGRNAVGVIADVTDQKQVDGLVSKTVKELGPLQVFVANAGIAAIKPLVECDTDEIRRVLDVNVLGVFHQYISAAKQMIKQGEGGKIIGAASIVAYRPFPLLTPYSASKWAVRGLTQSAAMEWGRYGIQVNAYAPGIVDTPMWDLIDEKLGEIEGLKKGEAKKKYVTDLITLKRISVPEDIGKVVSFLASPENDYCTGQCIIYDGGIQFA